MDQLLLLSRPGLMVKAQLEASSKAKVLCGLRLSQEGRTRMKLNRES